MKGLSLGVIAVTSVASIAFVAWRIQRRLAPNHYVAVVHDRSLSPRDGCASVVGLASYAISVAMQQRRDLSLTLFATGDQGTAYEPVQLQLPLLRFNGRVLEGKRSIQAHRQEFLDEVEAKCRALPPTAASPVFIAVKRAAEYVRGLGRGGDVDSELYVQTDLEENVEPSIARAIRAVRLKRDLPHLIDNDRLKVLFCGYADTTGQIALSSGRVQRLTAPRTLSKDMELRAVWTSIFTVPSLITIEPFCPKLTPELQSSAIKDQR